MKIPIQFFIICCFCYACSPTLTPFTQDLYDDFRWNEQDLRQIQFYLSHDLILRKELTSGHTDIVNGEIRIVDGRKVQEVVIPKRTPGVLVYMPELDRFGVSFEQGNDSNYLMFGPNPNYQDRYMILASEWQGVRAILQYEGDYFYTEAGSQLSSLMVDLKQIDNSETKRRKASGRIVSD